MQCQGPCLSHCVGPKSTTVLAYAALVYALASVGYLVATRRLGTPFHDSLTEEQRRLLETSSRDRKTAFVGAAAAAAVLLAVWRPPH